MIIFLFLILAAFTLSAASVDIIRRTLQQQLLDIPNDRSSHTQPTPRGGGIGFVIAFGITSTIAALCIDVTSRDIWLLWLTISPITIIGVIDDLQGVPAAPRYAVQLLAASLATFYFGAFPQPWLAEFGSTGEIFAVILTVIGFTAIVNFFNFMDGLDGLIAGCTVIQLSFLAIYLNQPLLWLLTAALLGFLFWNWSPAKIFMGDTGSTVLGATVAVVLLNSPSQPHQAWTALAITFPIIGDAIYTLIRRLLQKQNIFKAHRSHLFQRLYQSGWPHHQVALVYMGLTLIIATLIALYNSNGAWISLFVSASAIVYGERYLHSHIAREG